MMFPSTYMDSHSSVIVISYEGTFEIAFPKITVLLVLYKYKGCRQSVQQYGSYSPGKCSPSYGVRIVSWTEGCNLVLALWLGHLHSEQPPQLLMGVP